MKVNSSMDWESKNHTHFIVFLRQLLKSFTPSDTINKVISVFKMICEDNHLLVSVFFFLMENFSTPIFCATTLLCFCETAHDSQWSEDSALRPLLIALDISRLGYPVHRVRFFSAILNYVIRALIRHMRKWRSCTWLFVPIRLFFFPALLFYFLSGRRKHFNNPKLLLV